MLKTKKRIKTKLLCTFILAMIVLTYACRKDLTKGETLTELEAPLDVKMAKKIFNDLQKEKGLLVKVKKANAALSRASIPENPNNRRYPLYQKAYVSETNKSTFVEIPIVYNQRYSMTLVDPKISGETSVNDRQLIFRYSFDRFITYKSKITGKISKRMVTYIPGLAYLKKHKYKIKHNQINKLDSDFSGFIEFKEWDGEGIYLLQYEKGKKIRYLSLKNKSILKSSTVSLTKEKSSGVAARGCEIYDIEEWGETCIDAGPESEDSEPECTPVLISIETIIICDDGDTGDPCIDYGECETGDPCIDYGECDDDGEPETGKVDCAGVIGGSAYGSTCGCIGGTTGISSCPTDPCDRKYLISSQAINPIIAGHNTSILSNTTTYNVEYGTERNLKTIGQNDYFNTAVRTSGSSNTFAPNFSWNATTGYTVGAGHGHPGGSAPSPADAVWAYGNLNNSELLAGGSSGIDFYKANVSVMAATSNGNYVITVKDWTALGALYSTYQANPLLANSNYVTTGQQYLLSNPTATNEFASAYALLSIYGNAINVFKADAGSNTYTPLKVDNSGKVVKNPCE